MKIPESVRIGGIEYKVVLENRLNDGEKMLAGQIRYMSGEIAVDKILGHDQRCLTLWHEIMHGIEDQMQLKLGDAQEQIIDAFARGVYQVLQDNGARFFDISEEK